MGILGALWSSAPSDLPLLLHPAEPGWVDRGPAPLELQRGLRADGFQMADHPQPLVIHPGGKDLKEFLVNIITAS